MAAAKYEWTLNGKGAVTTETYTVPADAKSGDKIKLVVTAEDGETAEDSVYVGGFTILKVEPTTEAGGQGYKYIRAYFSSSLTSLAPEDIELRSKDTEQLYSIDTVKLSSDGTYADITLFGSVAEGETHFLDGGVIYVMTVTNNELSDSYEFELPIVWANQLVTKVDVEKGKIFLGGNVGYEVGDVYEGNLGTLVGRSVNVGVNSDREIEKLAVRAADVVYGSMKFNNKDNAAAFSDKDYFEDAATGTKYYLTATGTSRINATRAIGVVDPDDVEVADGVRYDYAKLVLNPNGTVACAVLDGNAWLDNVKVATVDGKLVNETSKTSVDFDGYTIEKNGEYVTTANLEEDDIVFYEATNKFAEVYNNEVSGEPSKIDSESISIDGTAYKWNPAADKTILLAKYYNADDDVYAYLMAKGDVEGQKILNGYDATLGVTAYLDRLGNIAYIEGTKDDDETTTDTWYVTTSAGAGYTQALTSYLKFKVSDGTEQTIEIPTSQLKKFNGVKGAIAEADDNAGNAGTYKFKFTKDKATDTAPFTTITAENMIESGVLVKVTRDENNKVIGLAFGGKWVAGTANDAYDCVTTIDGKNSNSFKADAKKVVTDGAATGTAATANLTASTNVWVYTVTKEAGKDDKVAVTKTSFDDFVKTTYALNATTPALPGDTGFGPFVMLKGSSVSDVLLRETVTVAGGVSTSNTFKDGDTEAGEGIIVGFTQKKKKDDDTDFVNTITVKGIDNVDVTYDTLNESIEETDLAKGVYAGLDFDKATGKIAKVTPGWVTTSGAQATDTIAAGATLSNSTEIITDNGVSIKLAPESLVLKWSGSKYSPIKLNQIAASTKDLGISWHDEYFNPEEENADGTLGVHYADFIVVEEINLSAIAIEDDIATLLAAEPTLGWDSITEKDDYDDAAADVALIDTALATYTAAGGDATKLDGYAGYVAAKAEIAEVGAHLIVDVKDNEVSVEKGTTKTAAVNELKATVTFVMADKSEVPASTTGLTVNGGTPTYSTAAGVYVFEITGVDDADYTLATDLSAPLEATVTVGSLADAANDAIAAVKKDRADNTSYTIANINTAALYATADLLVETASDAIADYVADGGSTDDLDDFDDYETAAAELAATGSKLVVAIATISGVEAEWTTSSNDTKDALVTDAKTKTTTLTLANGDPVEAFELTAATITASDTVLTNPEEGATASDTLTITALGGATYTLAGDATGTTITATVTHAAP